MLTCTQCGTAYKLSSKGPRIKYVGLCSRCRKKKHTEIHIQRHKDAYLQKHRFYHKKHAYGINAEAFAKLFSEQEGRCAICRTSFPPLSNREKRIFVDHDHSTGKVRSLLCGQCNSAVGMVKESVDIAERLAAYLRMHK
jgi:hypothetical protein